MKEETRQWRIEALERLQRELEEELQEAIPVPLTPQDSARIREVIRREIGERINFRFQELKKELREELVLEKKKDLKEAIQGGEMFYRFCVNIRAQHFVLAVSMVLLILSGLPVRFHDSDDLQVRHLSSRRHP